MGHSVKKETYVEADEKTARALTFDLLDGLHRKLDAQIENCNGRFVKLENHKKKNTAIASVSGFLGGFVAMAVYWIKENFK